MCRNAFADHGSVREGVCIDMCSDMCMDVCTDMCLDISTSPVVVLHITDLCERADYLVFDFQGPMFPK